MPFSIELTQANQNTIIKLQIVKNTLSFYFIPVHPDALTSTEAPRKAWYHLQHHFINELPGYNPNWVRGPDAPHIKRNHTSKYEIAHEHFHTEFNVEVTPELLKVYLDKFYMQQLKHPDTIYQFFTSKIEIYDLLAKFHLYYHEYKNSSVEEQYLFETKLTQEEKNAYDQAVTEHNVIRDLSSLLSTLINSNRHPLYQPAPVSHIPVPTLSQPQSIQEEDNENQGDVSKPCIIQ